MEQRVGDFLFVDDHLGQVGLLRLRGVGGKERRPGWSADDSSNLPAMAARLTANKTLIMMADLFLILIGTPLLPSSNSKWEGSAGLSDVYLAWKNWVCS